MLDKIYIRHRVSALKLKAAQKYNISPEKCHMGHVLLQGLLDRPQVLHQIDAATDERETNISVAVRSSRLASAMQKYGLQPGDSVVIMGYNHLDLVVPVYACHFNGYPMCAIDPTCTPADLQALMPYIKPKMIFCEKMCEEKVKDAFVASNTEGEIVIFDDKDSDFEAFIKQYKGTERNFREKFTGKFEITLAMATLQWVSSLIFFISGPLRCYTRLQSSGALTPQNLVAYINKYKPNVTAWTPYLLGQFFVAAQNGCDLSSFKYIAIGGSSIEKSLLDNFRKLCPAFLYLVYGMTELLVPIFDFGDDTPENSTGIPFGKYEVKLVDEDGFSIEKPDKEGELWIKGDDFFKGYLNNFEETRTMITDNGWIKTGDIFRRDTQNYYYFVERKRLLIKHFGYLISPLQIEEVIKRHPGVNEACVVGIPDPSCMELPIAAVQNRKEEKVDAQEIFHLLKNELPDRKQLRGGLFFIDSFPITPSGKVNWAKVRELALKTSRIMPK